MTWLDAPDYWLSRLVIERALGLVYLVAFLVVRNQFRPLLGERGLLPAPEFLKVVSFRQAPTIFHLRYSDRLLGAVAWTGIALSAALVAGLPEAGPAWLPMAAWLALWPLYLSIVNVGETFYAFGWESLLLEAGFLAIFLGSTRFAPSVLVVFLLRWLVFRLEFGAGLIKVRGDTCWRDLTCLYYHHETQPMPNPLSWFFHNLPKRMHQAEVLGNHFTQLVVPFALFLPQPIAGTAGLVILVTQAWLLLSGNFSWLNFLTMVLAISSLPDSMLRLVLPVTHGPLQATPAWQEGFALGLAILVVFLSYWPVRNLISRRQYMNASFNPFHLVNTDGAFGSVTRVRYEIVVEGADDAGLPGSSGWKEYEFKGKPGDPMRRPPQVAPYHLRLDWLMWFAAMSTPRQHPWFITFLLKLLQNDRATLKLLRRNPFPARPPAVIRARLYHYRFATPEERRRTRAWWERSLVGDYVPALSLGPATETGRSANDGVETPGSEP